MIQKPADGQLLYHQDLGLLDFQQAWALQDELFQYNVQLKAFHRNNQRLDEVTKHHLLFVEHPHVYTLGKAGDEKNLLLTEAQLAEVEASYFPINRGGDITYHGPGQLVGYPILDLDKIYTDIGKYLRAIEECVINVCAHYGISAGRIDGLTGVWIENRKICAIGVRASRWVTMHGFALNVNTNLNYFGYIIPCGIDDKEVTSLAAELGRPVDMAEVKALVLKEFVNHYGFQVV